MMRILTSFIDVAKCEVEKNEFYGFIAVEITGKSSRLSEMVDQKQAKPYSSDLSQYNYCIIIGSVNELLDDCLS